MMQGTYGWLLQEMKLAMPFLSLKRAFAALWGGAVDRCETTSSVRWTREEKLADFSVDLQTKFFIFSS
jgi:hypothetical protein